MCDVIAQPSRSTFYKAILRKGADQTKIVTGLWISTKYSTHTAASLLFLCAKFGNILAKGFQVLIFKFKTVPPSLFRNRQTGPTVAHRNGKDQSSQRLSHPGSDGCCGFFGLFGCLLKVVLPDVSPVCGRHLQSMDRVPTPVL